MNNIIHVFQEDDSVHGFQAISDAINGWWSPHKLDVDNRFDISILDQFIGVKNDNGDIEDVKLQLKMYDYIDNVSTTSGDDKVSNEVMNKVELRSAWGRYTAAVRDDYEYWRMCGESDTSGKLFLIDYNGDY